MNEQWKDQGDELNENEPGQKMDEGELSKPEWMMEELIKLEQESTVTAEERIAGKGKSRQVRTTTMLSILFLTLTVLCYGFATLLAFKGHSNLQVIASITGYHVGALIGVVLGLLVLTHVVWKKFLKKKSGIRLITYATLLLIFALVVMVTDMVDYQYRTAFMNDFEDIAGANRAFTRNDRERYGRYAIFADAIQDYILKEEGLNARFERDWATLGLDALFAEADFTNVEKLRLAQDKLQQEADLYERFGEDYKQMGAEFVAQFSKLPAPKNMEYVFKILADEIEQNVTKTVELIRYDRELSLKWEEFMSFLQTRVDSYSIVDGEFNFTTEEDWRVSDEFRATLDQIYQKSYEASIR